MDQLVDPLVPEAEVVSPPANGVQRTMSAEESATAAAAEQAQAAVVQELDDLVDAAYATFQITHGQANDHGQRALVIQAVLQKVVNVGHVFTHQPQVLVYDDKGNKKQKQTTSPNPKQTTTAGKKQQHSRRRRSVTSTTYDMTTGTHTDDVPSEESSSVVAPSLSSEQSCTWMRLSAVQLLAEVLLERAMEQQHGTAPLRAYPPLQPRQFGDDRPQHSATGTASSRENNEQKEKRRAMELPYVPETVHVHHKENVVSSEPPPEESSSTTEASIHQLEHIFASLPSPAEQPESLRDLHLSELLQQSEREVSRIPSHPTDVEEEEKVPIGEEITAAAVATTPKNQPQQQVSASPATPMERYRQTRQRQREKQKPVPVAPKESPSPLTTTSSTSNRRLVGQSAVVTNTPNSSSGNGNNILDEDDSKFPFMNRHTYQDDLYWAGQVRWPTATTTTTATTTSPPPSSWWTRRRQRRR